MLILASSSKYRKMLLQRLNIPFDQCAPDIDESPKAHETPIELVGRLATEKAQAVCIANPQAIVIGSDQIAVFDGRIVGKSGNHEVAIQQLLSFSGQAVEFLTAVSVICRSSGFQEQYIDSTRVGFRQLQADEIDRYLKSEKPYDCAGSFKAESLGIVLFESIISEDPTALIGLPLIRTATLLRSAGLQLP